MIADWLTDLVYYGALSVAWPFLLIKRRRTGKYRGEWGERLGKVDRGELEKALRHLGTGALRGEGDQARRHEGTQARRGEGDQARRHEGTEARREEGDQARRHEGTEARRGEGDQARRNEGTEARREEGDQARRHEGTGALRGQGDQARRHEGTEARREEGDQARRHEGTEARRGGDAVKRIMIHCVSVGELLSVRRLIEVLRGSDSGIEIVVTTTTDTGTARARALFADVPGVAALRYPLDLSWSVGRFLDAVRPTLILLVELETWPNFLRAAQRRKIPAAIINGRLTERSFKRYKLIRPIMRGMLRRLTWMGIQTETIAARFAALGAEREKISVIPTLKYDAAVSGPVAGTEAIARALGLDGAAPLLVAGSTGPGEERIVVEAFGMVRQRFAEVRLAIAPRKPEAVPLALEAIAAGQLTAIQRTQFPDDVAHPPAAAAEHVIVLDTLGELRKLYALATGVFVGRSLVPLGGSDMIEVAALGKPLCVGPHTANFAEVVEVLRAADAVREVTDARTLAATWAAWLANRAEAQAFGERGREAIEVQRGSTERYQQWISALAGS